MTKCLYVGNLPRECSEKDIRAFFEAQGRELETVIIVLDRRGRSRGFGFLDMASEEDVAAVVEELQGKEMDGRVLKFGTAHRDRHGDGGSTAGYSDYDPSYRPRGRGKGRGSR